MHQLYSIVCDHPSLLRLRLNCCIQQSQYYSIGRGQQAQVFSHAKPREITDRYVQAYCQSEHGPLQFPHSQWHTSHNGSY